jgi:hypothetical protein
MTWTNVSEVVRAMGRSKGAVHVLRASAYDQLHDMLGTISGFFWCKCEGHGLSSLKNPWELVVRIYACLWSILKTGLSFNEAIAR